jgi:hypothetical protein
MSRPEHPLSREELMAYVDGQLKGSQAAKVAQHIYGCPDCAAAVVEARQLSQQVTAWKIEEAPERIAERVLAELRLESGNRVVRSSISVWWTPGRKWAYGLGGTFVALLLLMVVVTPSLLRSRQAASESRSEFASQGLARTAEQQGQQGQQSSPGVASGPMVIRTIKLTLIAKEFDAARSRIDGIIRESKGYVDHLSVRGEAGSARTLSATLRLPAGQFESGLTELKKLGRLMEELQNSSDITSQYVDLAARLLNARNSEQRLLGLLRDRAGNLKDVIEMEREIASVRESIERMEAQQKDLNNKVQFVTIQLELAEEYHAQLESPAPSTGTQLRNAAVDGIRDAADNTVDIALFLLRYGPVLLIWFALIGSVIAGLWRLRLRIGA